MRRIAVINQKGGVGKTTTAVNLGAALAEQGRRVTLVDMDPQGNVALALGIDSLPGDPSIYTVLLGQTSLEDARIATTRPGLSLVPSNIDLSGAELELASAIGRESLLADALTSWTERARAAHGRSPADYVLFDCPPSLGLLSVNALAAADEVLLTVQTEFLALMGMSKLVEIVQLIRRRLNPELKITGIVPCLYDSRLRLAREVLAEIRKYFPGQVFQHPVRTNVKLAEAPSFGASILDYAPESYGALDYRRVALEVIAQEARDPELAGLPAPRPLAELPTSRPGEPPAAAATRAHEERREGASGDETPSPDEPAGRAGGGAKGGGAPEPVAAERESTEGPPAHEPQPEPAPAEAEAPAETEADADAAAATTDDPVADARTADAAESGRGAEPRLSPREPERELLARELARSEAAPRGVVASPPAERLPEAAPAPAFVAPDPRALVAYLATPRATGVPERERPAPAAGGALPTYVVPRREPTAPGLPRPRRSNAMDEELRILRAAQLPPLPREAFELPHGAPDFEG